MKDFIAEYKTCLSLLCEKHLILALDKMDYLIEQISSWDILQKKQNIAHNYSLLLEYYKNGAMDSQRADMHREFICQALAVLDEIYYIYRSKKSSSSFAEQCRSCATRSFDLKQSLERIISAEQSSLFNKIVSEAADSGESERLIEELFNQIWVSGKWNASYNNTIKTFVADNPSGKNITLPLLSAVMLSALYNFNENKITLLEELCLSDDPDIRARALFGLIVNMMVHHERIPFYREITKRANELLSQPQIRKDLRIIQLQLINYAGMPELTKFFNNMFNNTFKNIFAQGISLSDIENMLSDDNDEKAEKIDSEMEEKIKKFQEQTREIMDLNNDGYDINYIGFSNLKHFPFFQKTVNYFLPFHTEHSAIADTFVKENQFILDFIHKGQLCDSDKYSICLLLKYSPQNMKNSMLQKLAEEYESAKELMSEANSGQNALRSYIMDCVRYFKLYKNRTDFISPFDHEQLLFKYPFLESMFQNKDFLLEYAYHTQKLKMHTTAVAIYEYIDRHYTLDLESLQFYGYNLERLGRIKDAIICHEKASIIAPDSKWTLKHLGLCYLKTDNHQKALPVYSRLSVLYPDDKAIALRYGQCLMSIGKYDKALKQFHRAEFLDADDLSPIISIAECALLNGDAFQSDKYYSKIPEKEMTGEMCMFAGHAAWASGNLAYAIQLYKRTRQDIFRFSAQDTRILENFGIAPNDIILTEDIVNQKPSE